MTWLENLGKALLASFKLPFAQWAFNPVAVVKASISPASTTPVSSKPSDSTWIILALALVIGVFLIVRR